MDAQRLRVVHETIYRYQRPVVFGEHQAMFRPRDSHDLRLIDAKISLSPTGSVRWRHDVFGNSIALISFDAPADELRLASEIVIDHYAVPDPELEIEEFARRLPFT
ncbi:MAG: transglutaminase N-terminal domain-containing protein, partial [Pseudomonadota bacterium]